MRMHALACTAIVAATVAVAWPIRAAEPHWPETLTIGAASPGGTYYIYGAGLARILSRDLDLPVVMRPTEGPAENIALMEAGEARLGFVTVGVALQAWNATGVWAGKAPARALRAIFPMYDTPFQLLALQDANVDHPEGLVEEAVYMRDTVLPAMAEVRRLADILERTVADDLWPLPKYSEILFIK